MTTVCVGFDCTKDRLRTSPLRKGAATSRLGKHANPEDKKRDRPIFCAGECTILTPKHESDGAMGRQGTRLDLTADQAYELLNDSRRCFPAPGKKQLLAVKDNKIYVCQPDGVGGFHAYPSTRNEIATKYPSIAPRIASMMGVTVKRLSRMD